jgi:Rrf2 family protein
MKVSAREEYGLRCLMQLARRQRSGSGDPLSLGEIAREEGLSVPHVAKLIRTLRRAGLVTSTLGRTGGYVLARDASSISVQEVLAALGGKLYDTEYCKKFSGDLRSCAHIGDCSIRSLWGVLESLLERVLGRTMLADLVSCTESGMSAVLGGRTALPGVAAGRGR